ncbi:hypothetical protein BDM02DRAFT_3188811 [Thelephora ganbajun]|uniref:Uncharacterized protein n=1 Tax=Thelephora ganbajun TaxID=370292 RepID=A0ACB6Z9Z9_THEGA|nr:hypothetical protein BDM02DRAFT_3188811 [Thelephora ganbajun]
MLSVTRHSLSLSSILPLYRVPIRRNVVKLDRKYHTKVSGRRFSLPFALSKDDAVKNVAPWASLASMGKGLVRSLLARYLPAFGSEPLQPDDFKAVYIPVWFIDGEVMVNMTNAGTEVPAMIHSLNSYIPGFSFDPLSTLSFSQPRLEELAVPFTQELRNQNGIDVSCLPYSASPIPLPEVVKSLTPSQAKLPDSITFDPKSVDFSMLAAYPVLLPVYLIRYDLQIPMVSETISFTCMGLTYIDTGAAEIGNLLRETSDLTPGSLLHEFSHAMDDLPIRKVHGTLYGLSSIGIPITHPGLDSFNKVISDWTDEKIRSESDMAVLAEYGVDMDHPCVRVYTKEEVDANRRFLVASGESFTMQEFFRKVTAEKLQSGKIKFHANGRQISKPEALLEFLKQRMLAVEKQREELKPQWLRDWQDSQGRRQSAPP